MKIYTFSRADAYGMTLWEKVEFLFFLIYSVLSILPEKRGNADFVLRGNTVKNRKQKQISLARSNANSTDTVAFPVDEQIEPLSACRLF